jgi:DNA gyrase/topoisomerase IV subunit B
MKEYNLKTINNVQIRRKVVRSNLRYGKILLYTDADVDG